MLGESSPRAKSRAGITQLVVLLSGKLKNNTVQGLGYAIASLDFIKVLINAEIGKVKYWAELLRFARQIGS